MFSLRLFEDGTDESSSEFSLSAPRGSSSVTTVRDKLLKNEKKN